jgi:hypothetical protein
MLFPEVSQEEKRECVGAVVPMLRVGDDHEHDDGNDGVEKKEESKDQNEKRRVCHEGMGSRLQVAVLLQMPSPNRAGTHNKLDEVLPLECSVQGELAIGFMNVPWAREGHDNHSLERERTTTSTP